MKRKLTPDRLMALLKELEQGKSVIELSKKYGVPPHSIYNWKSKEKRMAQSKENVDEEIDQGTKSKTSLVERDNLILKVMFAELALQLRKDRDDIDTLVRTSSPRSNNGWA